MLVDVEPVTVTVIDVHARLLVGPSHSQCLNKTTCRFAWKKNKWSLFSTAYRYVLLAVCRSAHTRMPGRTSRTQKRKAPDVSGGDATARAALVGRLDAVLLKLSFPKRINRGLANSADATDLTELVDAMEQLVLLREPSVPAANAADV